MPKKGKSEEMSFPIKDEKLHFPHAFLLAASAGSGKTYNLANRYLQFLLSPKINKNSLTSILAITFTENATKEMKGRILKFLKDMYFSSKKRKEMHEIISIDESDMVRKADEALREIFSSYPDFNVATIDSFTLKILSVSVDELGIAPDYEVVFDDKELIDSALSAFFVSFELEKGKEIVDEFMQAQNSVENERFIFNPLSEVREKFSQFMEKENKYISDIKTVELDLKKHFDLRKEIIEKMKSIAQDKNELKEFYLSKVEEAIERKDYNLLMNLYRPNGAGFYDSRKVKKKLESKKDLELFLSSGIREINALLKRYYEDESKIFYNPYANFYIRFKMAFDEFRRRDKKVSLSRITAEMSWHIKKKSVFEIYLKLAAKLNHFLIDEFQDTNLAQWNILRPLVEDAISRQGSVFLIGDVKQAIYMFRNADYRIMSDFSNNRADIYMDTAPLEKGVEKFNLDINYRSDGEIISYVNSFFSSGKFKEYIEENIGEDFTGLLGCSQRPLDDKKDIGYVRTKVIKAKRGEGEEELKEEFMSTIKDVSARFPLERIAVLVKKNSEVEKIVEWLTEANIAAASFSSLDIRKRKIISEIVSLLTFLDNPSDNFSFATFILGEVFLSASGEKRENIFEFFIESNSQEKLIYASFKEKFPALWEKFFENLFSKSGYLTCYEIINLAFREFYIYEKFSFETAFLVKMSDIAYALNSQGLGSISDFIKKVNNASYDDESFSVVLPEFAQAVRVLTFHKAKGLGFAAVINILDSESWKSPGGERIYYSNEGDSLTLRRITDRMAELSDELKAIKEAEKRDEEIQNLNTLYVALTRAESEMVNIVKVSPSTKNFLSLFEDFEKGKKNTNLTKSNTKTNCLDVKVGSLEKIYDFIKNGEGDSMQTLRGNVYHRALSKIKYEKEINDENISILVDRACDFYGLRWGEEKREIIENIKKTCLNLREYFKEQENRDIKTEEEFVGENGSLIRVDRLVEDKDMAYVIDYKTGLPADYSKQLERYVKTVSSALGKEVKGIIYYIDSQKIGGTISFKA